MAASSSAATGAASGGTSRPIVFWGSGSPPAWRVCAVLVEKGVDFDGRRVMFDSGFLKTPEFLSLNPRGLVPTLVDGDVVIYESLAILHYIEDRYPTPPLLPRTPAARARALMRMQEANNASSAAGEVVYYVRRTKPEDINLPYLSCKFAVLAEELKLWESYLDGGCEFLAGPGENVSLADFAFFPNLCYMVRLGLELQPSYPQLARYFNRMCARASIQATWPPHWQKTKGLPCLSLSIFPPGFDHANSRGQCAVSSGHSHGHGHDHGTRHHAAKHGAAASTDPVSSSSSSAALAPPAPSTTSSSSSSAAAAAAAAAAATSAGVSPFST